MSCPNVDLQMSSIMQVEISMVEITSMTDQLHTEMNQCLDFVEDHLLLQVVKAKANPADAEAFMGISHMTNPAMESALVETSMICDISRSSKFKVTH